VTANAKPATANNLSILYPPVYPHSCTVKGSSPRTWINTNTLLNAG
jgi:hypothetical protein